MKVVIAGSSGFIGSSLIQFLKNQGYEATPLYREKKEGGSYWDPEKKIIDSSLLKEADVVINLAGENIFTRWNKSKMEEIRKSRVQSTEFLCETIAALDNFPKLYIGASAIGIYGDRGSEKLTEESPPGQGFLAEVCKEWEAKTETLGKKGVRRALTRFGIVLSKEGGALKKILAPFQMGMGGALGNGKQYVSWIALIDLLRAIHWIIEHENLSGPINITAPNPVTNKEMTEILGEILNRPTAFSIPKMMLGAFFGEGSEMFLSSLNVHPQKLLDSGFEFKFSSLEDFLKYELKGSIV